MKRAVAYILAVLGPEWILTFRTGLGKPLLAVMILAVVARFYALDYIVHPLNAYLVFVPLAPMLLVHAFLIRRGSLFDTGTPWLHAVTRSEKLTLVIHYLVSCGLIFYITAPDALIVPRAGYRLPDWIHDHDKTVSDAFYWAGPVALFLWDILFRVPPDAARSGPLTFGRIAAIAKRPPRLPSVEDLAKRLTD